MDKRNIKILIDMDDTIEDLLGSWVAALNKEHNTSVCVDDIDDWNIHQFFPELTRYQVFEPLFCGEFWDTVKPKKDAVYYVRKLKEDGFQIFICTNTNYKTLKEKMECVLFKHFDFLSWNDVIVTTNKQIIDADILVDDAVHNLIGGKYKGILFDAPHNRKFNEKEHGIIRANNWKDVYKIINDFVNEEVCA